MTAEVLAIEPLAQGSLSARAYAVLREALLAGRFRPGQRLVMQELAQQLGTSITPVREACLRLVSEGGLELRSGRFATVPAMTLDRYIEVRLMRLELEGLAARLAAERATPEGIATLHAIQPDYARADDGRVAEAAYRLNRDFHFAVHRLSGMPLLVAHIESLWVSMGPMLTVFFRSGERTYFGAQGHARIIRAIEVGDGAAAEEAIRQDIMDGGADFVRFLERNPGESRRAGMREEPRP